SFVSAMHQCAFVFACDGTHQRARLVDRKNLDGQFLVAAQSKRRRVHDFQSADDGLVETDARIARGVGVFVGVGTVDAVDLGRLEDNLGTDFRAAQGSGRVGREEGVARTGREDDDLAFLEIAQCLGADVGFDHLVDTQGRLYAGVDAAVFERILQGKRVHDGGHHAHVVGRGAIHTLSTRGNAAEYIAASDDYGQFDAALRNGDDFFSHAQNGGSIDTERVFTHEGFA